MAVGQFNEDINVLSAITVEIAMNNPKIYNLVVSILSHFISQLESTDKREKIAKNICCKFSRLPNSGYLQIWMQRITYQMENGPTYNEPICKIVNNESNISIWNNEWLKDELIAEFPIYSMKTDWLVKAYTPIIAINEVSVFDY